MSSTKTIRKTLYRNGVSITTCFILLFIAANIYLTFQTEKALKQSQWNHSKLDRIKFFKDQILINLNNTDMSIRGFLLVENDAFLETFSRIKRNQVDEFDSLNRLSSLMSIDGYLMTDIRSTVERYSGLMEKAVQLKKDGKTEEALKIIKEDHGTAVWLEFVEFSKKFDPLITARKDESEAEYKFYAKASKIFLIIPFIIGIPVLIFGARLLQRNAKKRFDLYNSLDKNNRELIFNSKKETDLDDEGGIVENMIENLSKISSFIKEIAQGNYNIEWAGLDESNRDLNKNTIAGELMNMKDEMQKKQNETERQKWASEGLNKLSEILRDNQGDFNLMTEKTTSFLVNYINAQQGALFILNEDDPTVPYLDLVSCYAFSRTKFIHKRVDIGEGLIGQIYLEAEPMYYIDIPKDHIKITTGLGDSTPGCLVLQPLVHNEKVEGVFEVASFKEFDIFTRDFLKQACKTMAASIVSLRIAQKTKVLLDQSQQQAEMMRAQEEEMRQNMEELEATQEEMKRKEVELRKILDQIQTNETESTAS